MQYRTIYCTGCNDEVKARLTDGAEIYPHRKDLADLPFWRCDTCLNYVGCHHKTDNPTEPKGDIPTADVRRWRKHLHLKVDPLWKRANNKRKRRQMVYALMSRELGYTYHAGEVNTAEKYAKSINAANRVVKEMKRRNLI